MSAPAPTSTKPIAAIAQVIAGLVLALALAHPERTLALALVLALAQYPVLVLAQVLELVG